MRSMFRSVPVAFVVVLALSAVAASGASASNLEWEVKEGGTWKVLGTGASKKVVFEGKGSQQMIWGSFHAEVVCEKAESEDGAIRGGKPGTATFVAIQYTECFMPKPAGCEVKSVGNKAGSITIKPPLPGGVEATLVAGSVGVNEQFSSSKGALFELEYGKKENKTNHKFETACGILPTKPLRVTGTAVGKLEVGPGGNEGEAVQFTGGSGSTLEIAGENFEWLGTESQTLASSGEGEALRVS